MATLCNVYKLIETAEQETKRGNLQNSILYYKETLKVITRIVTDIEKNELSDNVIEAVKVLRKDVSQTIYDLQNILDTDNEFTNQLNNNRLLESTENARKESTTTPFETADSNGISAQNYMGSIYMRLNNSMI
ncbi:hypothetical protein C6P45_001055 [Maudiozyma exigua]|uniref:MIT domain-containing protein n=1 Tax=Maudiozyma exigua TaxID=34358 RepID=A0A9P6W3F0_MAUEX|nr:hypothetical protein C6P45_001055 [Kazachstania exigua]